ncbi:Hypothetical protein, putative [Bodo saltans]|uniref:Uncharacterized protein n=1 Tax=Bodo saltans TaxID=75058 RepID=A0A0S4IIC8_BODSA|nr:Hypothetical protein, putative [Bodo saltans]|eukprot:CUE71453.1 Hypothetical protein, putative [Bodo saltans]
MSRHPKGTDHHCVRLGQLTYATRSNAARGGSTAAFTGEPASDPLSKPSAPYVASAGCAGGVAGLSLSSAAGSGRSSAGSLQHRRRECFQCLRSLQEAPEMVLLEHRRRQMLPAHPRHDRALLLLLRPSQEPFQWVECQLGLVRFLPVVGDRLPPLAAATVTSVLLQQQQQQLDEWESAMVIEMRLSTMVVRVFATIVMMREYSTGTMLHAQ